MSRQHRHGQGAGVRHTHTMNGKIIRQANPEAEAGENRIYLKKMWPELKLHIEAHKEAAS